MRTITALLIIPFRYLFIENRTKKWVDFFLPLLFGSAISAVLIFFDDHIVIFGPDGYIELITGLLQILTGFYIAALAAVSTFQSPMLDQEFDGPPVRLKEKIKGIVKNIPLTRRKFLSLLFGHLALLSIVVYFIGGFASLISGGVVEVVPNSWHGLVRGTFIVLYTMVSAHLFVVTMLGLYYLSYRIHRPPSGNQSGR